MNIVIVGSYPIAPDQIHGGVESSVYGLTKALCKTHTVDVFDMPRADGKDTNERLGNLTIHRYHKPGRHNRDALRRSKEMTRDIVAVHPDIVHIHGTGEFSHAIYAAVKYCGIPLALTAHGLLHIEKKNALRKRPSLKALLQYIKQSRTEFDLLNEASQIVVDTPYVLEQIKIYRQQRKIKQIPDMQVIPQGIDSAFYGIQCDPKSSTILCVGSISPRKGHLYTLQMFNQLRTKGFAAQLRIVGTLADKAYYDMLCKEVENSAFKNDIAIETNLSQQELLAAYQSAKLFALHSQEESQGIVLAEAMATGLPVVATKVGGIPDVIEDGVSGLLCNYQDAGTMAVHVKKLMSDQVLWEQFSKSAQTAAKRYDWYVIANNIVSLYQTIIEKAKTRKMKNDMQ